MELIVGVITAIVIPVLLWAWSLHRITKELHSMHLDPDTFGFGTGQTNKLLEAHIADEMDAHRAAIEATRDVKHAIRELTHYSRWAAEQRIGKKPPPYVRNGD